ncbi:MAG: hypothetical protein FWH55_11010, partial [Oscillospiraceae bacterium]|nr:hypothetical protein [Oscillospiraceae bacterium]
QQNRRELRVGCRDAGPGNRRPARPRRRSRSDGLARYEAAEARLGEIEAARAERRAKRVNIDRFLEALKKQDDLVTEFDEELWYITVDRVNVHADERLSIVFRDYVAVEIQNEK